MNTARHCSEPGCGAEVAADASDSLCMTCRIRLTLDKMSDRIGPAASDLPRPTPSPDGTAPPPLPRPPEFGPYELLEKIASGGMGVVYRARHIALNRIVALKMILMGLFASPEDIERFHSEAEAVAALDHPNIVPIYEIGEHEGQHYFTMKLIDGRSLSDQIPRFAADPRSAAGLMVSIARAVHHAHQHRILHRDLKPDNILLGSGGEPYVTDFGLAKKIEADRGLTMSGVVIGTPSYMSPEQASGARKSMTTATDVYSLGAVLYEMLTGKPPFLGRSPAETLRLVMETAPPRPRSLNPRVDRDLQTICLKCLEKTPQRRYSSAEALAEDLGRWRAGEPIQARRILAVERAAKWAKRRPVLAALVGVSAFALLTLIGGGTWFNRQLNRELGLNVQARRDLQLALTRQVAERLDSNLRQLAAIPQGMAVQLANRSDWTEAQLLVTLRAMLRSEKRLFGICVAFEPFQFKDGVENYALYHFRDRARGEPASIQLVPPAYRLYRDWAWYRNAKSAGGPVWIDPYYDQGGGEIWMTTYSVPIQRDGKFIGVVTADLSIKEYAEVVRQWLDELKLGQDAYGFVLDQTGANVTQLQWRLGKKLSELSPAGGDSSLLRLAERLPKKEQGSMEGADPRFGRACTFNYCPVPFSGWTFVAVVPEPSR